VAHSAPEKPGGAEDKDPISQGTADGSWSILKQAVNSRILLGLLLGLVAVGVGVVSLVTAVLTRRRRAEIAETYAVTGGIAHSGVQVGWRPSRIAAYASLKSRHRIPVDQPSETM